VLFFTTSCESVINLKFKKVCVCVGAHVLEHPLKHFGRLGVVVCSFRRLGQEDCEFEASLG
jgi:hypothetical protein